MKAATQSDTLIVPAGEFKAKCLRLMDEVNVTQRAITVTKRGKPVGQFVPMPADDKSFHSIFGRTPGIRIPDQTEWAKLKAEWADEWAGTSEELLRNIGKSKSRKL